MLRNEKSELRKSIYVERRGRQRAEETGKKLKETIEDLQKQLDEGTLREGNEHFSLRAGLELGLRRTASGVPAYALGLAGGFDVHGTTVGRWSRKGRGCQIGAMREFEVANYLELNREYRDDFVAKNGDLETEVGDGGGGVGYRRKRGLRFALQVLRADATSASVWHRRKLHVTLIRSVFLHEGLRVKWLMSKGSISDKLSIIKKSLKSKSCLAELLELRDVEPGVPKGGTIMAVVEKQIRSLAVPSWNTASIQQLSRHALEGPPAMQALQAPPAMPSSDGEGTAGGPREGQDGVQRQPQEERGAEDGADVNGRAADVAEGNGSAADGAEMGSGKAADVAEGDGMAVDSAEGNGKAAEGVEDRGSTLLAAGPGSTSSAVSRELDGASDPSQAGAGHERITGQDPEDPVDPPADSSSTRTKPVLEGFLFDDFDEEDEAVFNQLFGDDDEPGGDPPPTKPESEALSFDADDEFEKDVFRQIHGHYPKDPPPPAPEKREKRKERSERREVLWEDTTDSESDAPLRARGSAEKWEHLAAVGEKKKKKRQKTSGAAVSAAARAREKKQQEQRQEELALLSRLMDEAEAGGGVEEEEEEGEGILHVWCLTTDAGGDIAACKRRMESEVSRLSEEQEEQGTGVSYMLLSSDCVLHQYHIVVKEQLHLLDWICETVGLREEKLKKKPEKKGGGRKPRNVANEPQGKKKEEHEDQKPKEAEQKKDKTKKARKEPGFHYYSSLAKVQHTWRESGAKVYDIWHAKYGLRDAKLHAGIVPPQPISGRWGRASQVEAFLLLGTAEDCRTPEQIARILEKAAKMRTVFRELLKAEDKDGALSSDSSEEELEDLDHPTAQAARMRREAEEAQEAAGKAAEPKPKAAPAKPKGQWSVDEIRVEDAETYSKKMGKWRRSTWRVLQQAEKFFLVVAFAKVTRGRLDRLLYTVQKNARGNHRHLHVWYGESVS